MGDKNLETGINSERAGIPLDNEGKQSSQSMSTVDDGYQPPLCIVGDEELGLPLSDGGQQLLPSGDSNKLVITTDKLSSL